MDFVASRAVERHYGWRNRITDFLETLEVTVFDPWFKPEVRGLHEYGREDDASVERIRRRWSCAPGRRGAQARSWCAEQFWATLHIDLRMVDTSDFAIAYVPTNIYSVGTPHEIITATLQHKPVLFVSPPVEFPALRRLREHLRRDPHGSALLRQLEEEIPIKENPQGIPSLWYIPIVGGDNFFDGFGFQSYRRKFGWKEDIPLDDRERRFPPRRPLLRFLEQLSRKLPRKWDDTRHKFVPDDDWLLWDLKAAARGGRRLRGVRH